MEAINDWVVPDWVVSPRYVINIDTVNLDDLVHSRPGGIVRVYGDPRESVMILPDVGDSYAFIAGMVSEDA